MCVCLGVCVASFQFPSEQCFLCFFPTSLCGALVFDSVSVPPPSRHLRRLRPLFVTHHLSTHNFVTHSLSHATLSHPIFPHTTLSHTIFQTQLCHTPSFTHNFVTPHLSTHNFVTHHLSHTTLSHTIFHTQRHQPSFCLAGVELMALGWLWWRAWSPLVARRAAALCAAGVALGDIYRDFCVAGVALGDIHLRFAWQAWHLYGTGLALVARLVPFFLAWHLAWQAWHLATPTVFLRGRRGTSRHPPSFCVAHLLNTQPWTHISFKHTYIRLSHTNLNTYTHPHTTLSYTTHTHTQLFILFHTNLNTQFFHAQLCMSHSHLFHELEHTNFHTHTHTHNAFTHRHTTSLNTQTSTHNASTPNLSHTILSHANCHTQLFYTQPFTQKLFYTQLFHTLPFTHNSFTYNIVTHNLSLSHTALSHTTLSHTALSPTVLSHNLSSPSHFHTCFELVGRSWHVGLFGP